MLFSDQVFFFYSLDEIFLSVWNRNLEMNLDGSKIVASHIISIYSLSISMLFGQVVDVSSSYIANGVNRGMTILITWLVQILYIVQFWKHIA